MKILSSDFIADPHTSMELAKIYRGIELVDDDGIVRAVISYPSADNEMDEIEALRTAVRNKEAVIEALLRSATVEQKRYMDAETECETLRSATLAAKAWLEVEDELNKCEPGFLAAMTRGMCFQYREALRVKLKEVGL